MNGRYRSLHGENGFIQKETGNNFNITILKPPLGVWGKGFGGRALGERGLGERGLGEGLLAGP